MSGVEIQSRFSSALKSVEIDGKGRGLVAAQALKGGQVVMRDSPILVYSTFPWKRSQEEDISPSYSRYCGHCFRSLVAGEDVDAIPRFTCPLCCHPDDAVFCSSRCRNLALNSSHTTWVCQSLSYLRNCPSLLDGQPEERQVQARGMVAAYNLAMVSPSSYQALLNLHGKGARRGEKGFDVAIFLHSLISMVPFPQGFSMPSVETTADIIAKDWCNSFCLMEPVSESGKRSVRAYALYPNASLFNHDCLPNACRFDYLDHESDDNTDIIIRMIHDVPQGEEVCISYFRINLSYDERCRRLQNDFQFACLCYRCKVEAKQSMNKTIETSESEQKANDDNTYSSFASRFLCNLENCGGTLAPVPPSDDQPSDMMECNFCGNFSKAKM